MLLSELRKTILHDFYELYTPKYTTNWEAERMVCDIEIGLMEFDHTLERIAAERAKIAQEILGILEHGYTDQDTQYYGVTPDKLQELKAEYEVKG